MNVYAKSKVLLPGMLACVLMTVGCGSRAKDSVESGDTIRDSQSDTPITVSSDSAVFADSQTESGSNLNFDSSSLSGTDSTGGDSGMVSSDSSTAKPTNISIHFEQGDAEGGAIVYVMWLESRDRTFIQNLYICERLLNGTLSGTALPYWQMNKKDHSSIDGISGATQLPQVNVTKAIAAQATSQFTVFAELDHSWDGNDWFGDQPALLYAVDVDLNRPQASYQMLPIGWTLDQKVTFSDMTGSPSFGAGELVSEMRYITHTKDAGGFGEVNMAKSATSMVKALTVTLH